MLSPANRRKRSLYTVAALASACSFMAQAASQKIIPLDGLATSNTPDESSNEPAFLSTAIAAPLAPGAGNLNAVNSDAGTANSNLRNPGIAMLSSGVSPSATVLVNSAPFIEFIDDHVFFYEYYLNPSGFTRLRIHYNNSPEITVANPLRLVSIQTSGGLTLNQGRLNTALGFSTLTYTSTTIMASILNGSIPDGYDLGDILPGVWDPTQLASLITLKYQVAGGGLTLKTANLQVIVATGPEPTNLTLLGLGAGGLLARHRRRRIAKSN